jgi:hypothetical protein
MIGIKLKELEEYIKKIDKFKPIRFLESYIKKIEDDLKEIDNEQLRIAELFNQDLILLIEKYTNKRIYNSIIINEMYNFIINFSRRSAIESKAALLGINKKLYKKEMSFLFKGKT